MLGLLNGYICLHSFSVVLLSLVRLWLWLNRCISFLCYLVLLLLWFLSIVLLVLAQIYILWLNRYISFGFAPYALLSAILCFFGCFLSCYLCFHTYISFGWTNIYPWIVLLVLCILLSCGSLCSFGWTDIFAYFVLLMYVCFSYCYLMLSLLILCFLLSCGSLCSFGVLLVFLWCWISLVLWLFCSLSLSFHTQPIRILVIEGDPRPVV